MSQGMHFTLVLSLMVAITLLMGWPSPVPAQNFFQKNDRNGDGRLSPEEFPGPPRAFRHMDRNGDGFLTPQEIRQARGDQRGGPPSRGGPQQIAPMHGQEKPRMMERAPAAIHSGPFRFVDTHMHLHPIGLDQAMGGGRMSSGGNWPSGGMDEAASLAQAADNLVSRMDQQGIAWALVVVVPSSKQGPKETYHMMRKAVSRQPDRLRLMAGGAILGTMLQEADPKAVTDGLKKRFRQAAEKVLDEGAAGFGEMISYHLCMTQRHSFKYTAPNHPLFLLLADIAAERNVPIDIHMEAIETAGPMPFRLRQACTKNPAQLTPTIPDFEALLRHNRNARIVWQHIGWDNTGQMRLPLLRRLLQAHSNLYLSLRVPQHLQDRQGRPIANRIVDLNMRVSPDWEQFMEDFQDRLMLGADEFIGPNTEATTLAASFDTTWAIVDQLPEKVARKIGGDNAKRLYRLQ